VCPPCGESTYSEAPRQARIGGCLAVHEGLSCSVTVRWPLPPYWRWPPVWSCCRRPRRPPARFTYKIHYDSPGSDRGGNASLNSEYVQIRNTTSQAVNLRGWTLTDASNHRYTFGSFTLGKGKTVTVRTGQATNTTANRYQGRKWYVWNNDKDTATLRKSNGSRVDTCSYNSSRVDYKMC
jgi:hypothetical protein